MTTTKKKIATSKAQKAPVRPLTLAWAIGIGCIVGFLTRHETPRKNDGEIDSGKALAEAFFGPLFALLVAWVIHQFMQ